MAKDKIYLGKFKVNDVQHDSVKVKGECFDLDPSMIEMEEHLGTYRMRQQVKELGLKYIRVTSNKRSYIFTN
jgi:predicted HAD superfamily phosphohydrolase YqeG